MDDPGTISLNGRRLNLATATVAEALCAAGFDPAQRGIAVAVNGAVVARSVWPDRRLEPGDTVEVVGAVQGG